MEDHLKTDLRVEFTPEGQVDLQLTHGDLTVVRGRDNLAQALRLRLLTARGDLTSLGHSAYGSRVHELVGEPVDRDNLQLLRRLVKQALLEDPRVDEITRLQLTRRPDAPGVVQIDARIRPVDAEELSLEATFDVG